MKNKDLFALFLVISLSLPLLAQNLAQWQVDELRIKSKRIKTNPYQVALSATFTHVDGTSMNIPGFYDGDQTWVVRYCLPKEGHWNYVTSSPEKALNGKKGELAVGAPMEGQHGPIVIPENNLQRFAYADGTPYHLLAYELDWLFALDVDSDQDLPKTRQIIGEIKANGFNQVVMNVYAYDAGWGERDKINPLHNFAKPEAFPFGGNNINPDYSTLNISFFQHLDRVIAYLNEQNVVAHLMIYVWNKKVNWPDPNSEADNRYFDYVVKRYQAYPNLIWDISKEALAYGRDDMSYITERIERLRAMDGHQRLLSVHDYNYCQAYPDQVDFISIQEWAPNLYNMMLDAAEKHPKQPIFNIEHGGYEKTMHQIFGGAYSDPVVCLLRNYECAFAGTYSTYYWQNTSWYEVVYNPMELPEAQQPNLNWYRHFHQLLERYQFDQLKPWQNAFTTYGLHNQEAGTLLLLVPEKLERLSGTVPFLKHKKVKVEWFDPFTGRTFAGPERNFQKGTWLGFEVDKRITAPFGVAILHYD